MWMEVLVGQNQVQKVMDMNQKTERFGLSLTQEDAELLVERKMECLKEQQRVEFGETILSKLIDTFCDSPYINQENIYKKAYYLELLKKYLDEEDESHNG